MCRTDTQLECELRYLHPSCKVHMSKNIAEQFRDPKPEPERPQPKTGIRRRENRYGKIEMPLAVKRRWFFEPAERHQHPSEPCYAISQSLIQQSWTGTARTMPDHQ